MTCPYKIAKKLGELVADSTFVSEATELLSKYTITKKNKTRPLREGEQIKQGRSYIAANGMKPISIRLNVDDTHACHKVKFLDGSDYWMSTTGKTASSSYDLVSVVRKNR